MGSEAYDTELAQLLVAIALWELRIVPSCLSVLFVSFLCTSIISDHLGCS